ncbi:hypothetical protein J6590_039235 [Homalodisca vitripennis]|nr:hypothetical protein J6590_039235 [Homalodisca vitripennis]
MITVWPHTISSSAIDETWSTVISGPEFISGSQKSREKEYKQASESSLALLIINKHIHHLNIRGVFVVPSEPRRPSLLPFSSADKPRYYTRRAAVK